MKFAPTHIPDLASALAPPPRLTISQWAEAYRVLPEASAARGGRWRNRTCPYLVGIMDAPLEPGVRQIAIMKGAQLGVSESLCNIVGYFIANQPCPMLFVLPTHGAAVAFSKERIADMVRSTAPLRALVQDKRIPGTEGRPESTLDLKLFPAGFLAITSGNSPTAFARWSVRVAIADDADRLPVTVADEGDPGRLLTNRTTSFIDPLVIFCSTPVLRRGRISMAFAETDQRRYHVVCPRCHRVDFFTWSDREHFRVVWDDRTPTTARIECVCGQRIDEPTRRALIATGAWRATATPIAAGLVGFHAPALISTFLTLEQLVTKFLSARTEGPMRLKEFVTTILGEGWEDPHERLDPLTLRERAEDF